MKTGSINSPEALREWLEDKPYQWAQVVSSRTALRTFPCLVNSAEDWLTRFALGIMRAGFISWAAANLSSLKIDSAGTIASHDVIDAAQAAETFASRTLDHINRVPANYDDAQMAMNGAVSAQSAATALSFAVDIAQRKLKHIGGAGLVFLYANSSFAAAFGTQSEIAATREDCEWLSTNAANNIAAQVISVRGLWLDAPPVEWSSGYDVLRSRLLMIDPNYFVWLDWYERRIRGEDSGFTIPGDKDRKEDKAVVRKLARATDEDFWGKGHEYVNATLKGWLDEARARVAPSPIIGEASGALEISGYATGEMRPLPPEVPAKLPSQNTNAISFRTDNDGRIAINADALADRVRTDAGARDRHEEAVNEARNALNRCQGNNAAARLTGLLTNYLVAAGENLKTTKPSLLVQRGERLRQELARYEAPDHMLPPVADDLLLDLKGWLTAHNMVVGLDPVLNAMDTAMLGPDRQPTLIPPDEIREKAREAEEADLLQDGVIEVVEEAADLAPAVPDANDRHTIWSTEIVRNLIIETASVALNNPAATGTVVAVGALLSSGLAVGIAGGVSIMGSIKAAEYLVTHKEWVLARLGNTPTWQALITKLSDWLEKMTPFEPK